MGFYAFDFTVCKFFKKADENIQIGGKFSLKAKNRKLHRSYIYIYIYLDKNERDKMAVMANKACELGNPHSCLFLGNIYLQKDTLVQEKEEGLRLYDKACELKNAFACYTLALIYEAGDAGIPKDKNRAKNYYKRACELDLEEACSSLKISQ